MSTASVPRRKRDLFAGILLQPPLVLALEFALVFLLVIALLSVPLVRNGARLGREQFDRSLGTLAITAAALVDGDAHDALRNHGDEFGPAYARLLEPLVRFQNAAPGVHNLYTLRADGDRLVFVLDTARSPGLKRATDKPSPFLGTLDFDLSQEPEMMPALLEGKPFVDREAYRSRTTGRLMHAVQAPIHSASGRMVGIIALEYNEQDFRELIERRRGRFFAVAVLLDIALVGTIAALVYWLRRQIGDALAALEREAKTDSLTQLYNRRYFNRRLASEVARARARNVALGLLIFDADYFKRINDTHGHPAGDAVLVRIAECLRSQLDATQRAFRIGGEEFAVLLRDADAGRAMGLFQRLSQAIRQPFAFSEARIEVTVSGGIAELKPGENGDDMLSRADQALYVAKNGGRDFAVVAAAF